MKEDVFPNRFCCFATDFITSLREVVSVKAELNEGIIALLRNPKCRGLGL